MAYHTYHCLCSELIVAVPSPLDNLPRRSNDSSFICSLDPGDEAPSELAGVAIEPKAIVLKLKDGFEKRYAVRCVRCHLTVGYQLDKSQYGENTEGSGSEQSVVYILPGGLMNTAEMQAGKDMEKEIQLVGSAAA